MGLTRRLGIGATAVAFLATGALALPPSVPTATASGGGGAVPLPGDWEGTGAHGLPLSFSLARRHGRLVATSVALGAPLTCPATERDAEAVPLADVSYAGPGGGERSSPADLSGQIAQANVAHITGAFATRRSGTFSVQVTSDVGCGWPSGTLTWQVRKSRRVWIADRTWTARLSGPDITAGRIELKVAALGRVVQSFRSSFKCRTASSHGATHLTAAPAYEFIRPDGRFYSPLDGNTVKGHPTLWVGRFTAAGVLTGTLKIYDSCRRRLVTATFRGAKPRPHLAGPASPLARRPVPSRHGS